MRTDGHGTPTAQWLDHLERFLRWLIRSRALRWARPLVNALLAARTRLFGRERVEVPGNPDRAVVDVRVDCIPVGGAVLPPNSIVEYERKLWGGYGDAATRSLLRCIASRRESAKARAEAAWALVRYNALVGEYEEALRFAVIMRAFQPRRGWESAGVLMEVDCLNRLGRCSEARAVLDDVVAMDGKCADYCLAYANTYVQEPGGAGDALAWLNEIYRIHGVGELRLREASEGILLSNLSGAEPRAAESGASGPRVSVLMPTHDSEGSIRIALQGLLEQTWRNLEVLVVDDCSLDATADVVAQVAANDCRVKLLRHRVNTGAYGARRTALEQASGDLITVHDADDWSHPEKIERQVQALQEESGVVANMSSWCRVSESMYVNRVGAIPGGSLQRQNESSLMFRRELVDEIGTWDHVRAAADTEYIWRIQARYGRDSVQVILPEVPLSFSLSQEDSLTRTGPTHVRTIFHGTRRVYREAQKWWHRQGNSSDLAMPSGPASRPFYCPPNLLTRNPPPRAYDVVLVADFALRADAGLYAETVVQAAARAGYAVGVFHWRRFDKPIMSPVRDVFQKLAAEGAVDIIAAEDRLNARHAVVLDPVGPEYRLDPVPDWQVEALSVVTGHREGSAYPGGAEYDAQAVSSTLESVFGMPPRWVAVTTRDRDVLVKTGCAVPLTDGVLPPPLDPQAISSAPREASQRRPVAGRIDPGQGRFWPDEVDELRSAYCADQKCEILIGGLSVTMEKALGRLPRNWRLLNGEAALRHSACKDTDLDFFLYFPGGCGLAAAGLQVWEACARGQVVLTEPGLEPFFGDAAVYAQPGDVWSTLSAIWQDADRYRRQSERALDCARARATTTDLVRLVGEPTRRVACARLQAG